MTVLALELEVGGLVRTVQVERAGDRFTVVLDGTRHVVDAAEIEPGRWSLLFDQQGASHEVLVRNGRGDALTVLVDGAVVPVTLRDPRRRLAGRAAVTADGPVRLVAPMPGKVVRVLVAPGDAVAVRQGLVVVEAMKMENEIRAPRPGVVADIFVREGTLVEAGAPLLTLG
jgi:biotin carboxyl carrier protein